MFGNEEVDGNVLSRKWLIVNEEVDYKIITNCTNAVELRNTGKYLFIIRCTVNGRIRFIIYNWK
jgi:hypothetical protein